MNHSKSSIRYAKALLQLSKEQKLLEQSYNDMLLVKSVCSASKDLILLLKSPIIKTDQKLKIINEIFGNKISELSMRFLNIITRKKREYLLLDISSSFILLYKKANNIVSATVTTATPLTNDLRSVVVDFIKSFDDKKVELTEHINEKIIGGAVIRIGDKQLDASISNDISELRQVFNKNLYKQDF